ncbi:MAG: TrmH family RNA methyltransferase [Bacteroidota bacterium]
MNTQITSLQNEKVKNLIRLQKKAPERKEQGMFVVEGIREVSLALKNKVKPHSFFICKSIYSADSLYPIDFQNFQETPVYEVSPEVYNKIAYRGDTQGIMMIAHNITKTLEDITTDKNSFYMVLESIEKPGNLGAVMRTADASGISGIIICGQNFDIYNPNVIRASLGCIFTLNVIIADNNSVLTFFKKHNCKVLAAHPEGKINYSDVDYKQGTAIVMGTESEGLSSFWKENADNLIRIPMLGQIDSLNISVSAAVITYEALRQRRL